MAPAGTLPGAGVPVCQQDGLGRGGPGRPHGRAAPPVRFGLCGFVRPGKRRGSGPVQRGPAGSCDGGPRPWGCSAGRGCGKAAVVPLLLRRGAEAGGGGLPAGELRAPDPAPAPSGGAGGPGVQGDPGQLRRLADLAEGHRRGAESESGALRPAGRPTGLERQGGPAADLLRYQVPAGGYSPARGRGGSGGAFRPLSGGGPGL